MESGRVSPRQEKEKKQVYDSLIRMFEYKRGSRRSRNKKRDLRKREMSEAFSPCSEGGRFEMIPLPLSPLSCNPIKSLPKVRTSSEKERMRRSHQRRGVFFTLSRDCSRGALGICIDICTCICICVRHCI